MIVVIIVLVKNNLANSKYLTKSTQYARLSEAAVMVARSYFAYPPFPSANAINLFSHYTRGQRSRIFFGSVRKTGCLQSRGGYFQPNHNFRSKSCRYILSSIRKTSTLLKKGSGLVTEKAFIILTQIK